MSIARLEDRRLPRAERNVAPVIWEMAGAAGPSNESWQHLKRVGATWFLAPLEITAEVARVAGEMRQAIGDELRWVVPVFAEELLSRRSKPLESHLETFGVNRCEAVLLEDATPGDVKAGGPFHRLAKLRERGLVDWFIVSTPDHATAEWMVHHSPAHAVCLPFGIGDMTAKYRLLEDARNFGTGIIARAVNEPAWQDAHSFEESVAFTLGEPDVTSILAPLDRAQDVLSAIARPMDENSRRAWWERFQRAVSPPAMPVRNLPPEFG